MRILLFGGSFNPLHNGHLRLTQWALAQGYAEEIWLMVSPQNPLKPTTDLLDEQIRLRLCRQAIKETDGVKVSDFEFHLSRPSYTWDTLQHLREAYPKHQFSLLIGADNWINFHHWAHWEDLLAHYRFLIYPRRGYTIDSAALPPSVVYLEDAPIYPYSSTSIRAAVRRGESINEVVPASICAEVKRRYSQLR